MNAYRILPNYTYDDYCQWEGRWEIIDGIPYAMSPMPLPLHQLLANEIGAVLSNQFKSQKCLCKVYQAVDDIMNIDLENGCQMATDMSQIFE